MGGRDYHTSDAPPPRRTTSMSRIRTAWHMIMMIRGVTREVWPSGRRVRCTGDRSHTTSSFLNDPKGASCYPPIYPRAGCGRDLFYLLIPRHARKDLLVGLSTRGDQSKCPLKWGVSGSGEKNIVISGQILAGLCAVRIGLHMLGMRSRREVVIPYCTQVTRSSTR